MSYLSCYCLSYGFCISGCRILQNMAQNIINSSLWISFLNSMASRAVITTGKEEDILKNPWDALDYKL
ncbi:hypothetical protein JTE90_019926 [Oedothorax gibbosus]|uniref:Uncharacterized protein n=1 Tax=Oedothorax gibbosus TaxID=931172 RepID=A0AAV6UR74_9ARAC|nr:hypothetical protein JTE90_019926 [Oedothorax gibbosus]